LKTWEVAVTPPKFCAIRETFAVERLSTRKEATQTPPSAQQGKPTRRRKESLFFRPIPSEKPRASRSTDHHHGQAQEGNRGRPQQVSAFAFLTFAFPFLARAPSSQSSFVLPCRRCGCFLLLVSPGLPRPLPPRSSGAAGIGPRTPPAAAPAFLTLSLSLLFFVLQEGPEEGPEARGADPVPRGVRWRFPFRSRSARRAPIARAPRAAHRERERGALSLSLFLSAGWFWVPGLCCGGWEVRSLRLGARKKRPRRGCPPSSSRLRIRGPQAASRERKRAASLARLAIGARFVPSLWMAVDSSSLLHCFLSSLFRSCLRSAPRLRFPRARPRDLPRGSCPCSFSSSLSPVLVRARAQPPEHGRGGQDQGADRRHLGQGKRGAGAVRGSRWAFRRATALRGECNEEENGSGGMEGGVVGRK
jgi:hypothetical protein